MTLEEYFEFLEQYWSLFPVPTEPKAKKPYLKILI